MHFWKVMDDPFAAARESRRSTPVFLTFIISAALFVGYFFAQNELTGLLYNVLKNLSLDNKISTDLPFFDDMDLLTSLCFSALLFLITWLYVRFIEGRKLSSCMLNDSSGTGHIIVGVVIGAGMALVMVFGLSMAGILKFSGKVSSDLLTRLLYIVFLPVFCFSMELFFHGFLLSSLGSRTNFWFASIMSGILYSAATAFFFGYTYFTLIVLFFFGTLLSFITVRTGSMWEAFAIRVSMMYVLGPIFGTTISGLDFTYAFITTNNSSEKIISGYEYGIDGSLLMLVIALISLFVVILKKRRVEFVPDRTFAHIEPEPKQDANDVNNNTDEKAPDTAPDKKDKNVETSANYKEDDDYEWEEEESREHVEPNYRKPEEYLKKDFKKHCE